MTKNIRAALPLASAFALIATPLAAQDAGERIPGFGHPLHKPVDPRAQRILSLAEQSGHATAPFRRRLRSVELALLEPLLRGDEFVPRLILPLSLSYDHRVIDGALRQAEAMRIAREEALIAAREEAEGYAQSLTGTRVVVAARASDEGKLFGSIGDGDIAAAITKFTGITVDRKIGEIETPIREIGLHEVMLRPHPEVEFAVTLDVIPA